MEEYFNFFLLCPQFKTKHLNAILMFLVNLNFSVRSAAGVVFLYDTDTIFSWCSVCNYCSSRVVYDWQVEFVSVACTDTTARDTT